MQFHCTICDKHEDLWPNIREICVTKCGHLYHLSCLMIHISSRTTKCTIECPTSLCNMKIKQSTIIQIDSSVLGNQASKKQNIYPVNCVLCDDPVTDPDNISLTKCGHIYHHDCLTALVRPKSNACMVPSCNKKITPAAFTRIQFLPVLKDERTPPNDTLTEDELRALLEGQEGAPCQQTNETKSDNCPESSCKKDIKPNIKQTPPVKGERSDIQPATQSQRETDKLSPLLQDRKNLCGPKNEQLDQQIKLDLDRECLMNMLDEEGQREHNEVTQNNTIDELNQKCKALEEQMEVLEKDRSDAKKDTSLWEMSFKYLQDKFQDTDMMIPNEQTLELIRENERLKMYAQDMERERNNAKKETAIWEMSFTYLQENFKDTDLMIPDEKTLQIIKENETLKICIQDLGSKLVSAKNERKSEKSLRAEFEKYIEENLNLKNENEKMKSDIKILKDNMSKLDTTITDLVIRHSQENETLNELTTSLLTENSRLSELNDSVEKDNNNSLLKEDIIFNEKTVQKVNKFDETLHKENDNLQELNKILQKDNNKLHEFNEILQKDNKKLHELNEILQKADDKLRNETLQKNNKLHELNENLQMENNKLQILNVTVQKDYNNLQELNKTLKMENKKRHEFNNFLLKENSRLKELRSVQNERRGFQWVVSRRRSCTDSVQSTRKRRFPDVNRVTEKQAVIVKEKPGENRAIIDLMNKEAVKQEQRANHATIGILNNEAVEEPRENQAIIDLVNKEAIKKEPRENDAIVDFLDTETVKEKSREQTITDIVNKESVKEDPRDNQAFIDLVNKEAVQEETKSEEPDIKRIKLEINDETGDGASTSSSVKINQAICEIEDVLNL